MNCGLARNQSCRFLKVWGCDAYMKKFQVDKLEPKADKMHLHRKPKGNYWVHLLSQIQRQVILLLRWILSREGVSLERSEWEESRT